MLHIRSYAAAVFHDPAMDAVSGSVDDHTQAAFLPGAPDIGWLAPQGSFIQIAV
jgi:hypothetical protein